jgi:choline dehydrogenase-like flavoprotein
MLTREVEALARGGRVWDACIVGSGPAGITLARALGARGWRVLLLEAGAEQVEPEHQADLQGEVMSDLPLNPQWSRLRCLGGSSNHWGGFCQALDAADFEAKVPGLSTDWPIGARDLAPWQTRAEEILEIGPPVPEVAYGEQLRIVRMRYSPPVQFGRKYRTWLEHSPQVTTLLGTCLTGLHESGGRIDSLTVSDTAGQTHRLRARQVVLCAGGIENSRLLLWAHACSAGRIVREPRALGRYWCEHPHFTLGEALLSEHAPFEFDAWNIAWLMPTARAMRESGALNAGLRLTRRTSEATVETVRRLACVAPELGRWAMRQAGRRLICGVLLRAAWEQTPRPWNRVVLSADKDRYGMPRPEIHWRLDEQDRHTVRAAATLLGAELARRGHGRVRLDPWLMQDSGWPTNDETVGNHHMGGTRMARDPREGVVDEHCRVHGLANLHVAGSSVFPGVGAANPTLTIVQLALRLADRLDQTRT